jgi:putative ribosome biogenesis GTPase RsgA
LVNFWAKVSLIIKIIKTRMQKGAYCGGCNGIRGKSKPQSRLETQLKVTRSNKDSKSVSSDIKHIEAKVILLGDSGVGKSSLAKRYCQD